MVSSRVMRGLVALSFGLAASAQGSDPECVRSVVARAGDTCASLADFAGISVTQFLRSNPFVTSCSTLISGAIYCAEGTASGPPIVPAASTTAAAVPPAGPGPTAPAGPLRISPDGSCGGDVTCAGSRFGLCCSAHGFCGTSDDYCGEGCQVGLGECKGAGEPPVSEPPVEEPSNGIATSTTTVTATIFITNTVAETTGTTTSTFVVTSTSLAYGNVTSTVLRSTTRTATATQTVRATIIITSTVFQTNTLTNNLTLTQTARTTATNTAILTVPTTETSLVISTTTSVASRTSLTIVTRTVQVTSIEIDTLTTVVTSTSVATSTRLVTSTATATATATVTSTRVLTVTSTNYAACSNSFGIGNPNPPSFITNPTFVIGPTPTRPGGGGGGITTVTEVATGAPARPSPILPGAPRDCKTYDKIQASDTCRILANRNEITLRDFYKLNPSVSSGSLLGSLICTPELLQLLLSGLCQIDCDELWVGYYVCTGT